MSYMYYLVTLIAIYAMLGLSWNLVAGYGGLMSFAHAAFYGVGAYVAGTLSVEWKLTFVPNLGCALVLSGGIAAIVAVIALRTIADYFILCTVGLQMIAFSLMNNWISVTKGPFGIINIPAVRLFGQDWTDSLALAVLATFMCACVFVIVRNVASSPLGRVLSAVREDEILCQAAGRNIYKVKITVFVLGAMLASAVGVFHAHYFRYIDPTAFNLKESILIVAVVIIGGMGNLWGSIIGAAIVVMVPEIFRMIGLPATIGANVRQMLYGLVLIGLMIWRPHGIVGRARVKPVR